MASWLKSSGPGSGPGRGHRVLGQDTLLSRCLSPPRCINGYRRNQVNSGEMIQYFIGVWTSIPSRGEYKYS